MNQPKPHHWHQWRVLLALLSGACLACSPGCFGNRWQQIGPWDNHVHTAFPTLNPEDDGVAQLDIATAQWRLGEPTLERDIWTELDEQFISSAQRQLFQQNGLRIGLMRAATGSKLQAVLSDPHNAKSLKNSLSNNFIQWWTYVGGTLVEVPKALPVCTVDARRILTRLESDLFFPVGGKVTSAQLLMPNGADWQARPLEQIELGFALRVQKLPESLTKLTLVPVVKYSLTQQTMTDVFLDSLRKKSGIERHEERLEALALDVTLGNDQYLIISPQANETILPPGVTTFGELGFLEANASQQTMLVIRGASVAANRLPDPPKKGQAWPLAWQAAEMTQPPTVGGKQ